MEIPGVNKKYCQKLASIGIVNTKDCFERCQTEKQRKLVSKQTAVPLDYVLELLKLSDLARIRGVGPIFIRIFYDTGIDTIKKVSTASAKNLFDKLQSVNKTRKYTNAKYTVKDVQDCIDRAKDLPKVVEY